MTAERVDAVIAAVERHDPELASWMRMAADGLTAGEGEEVISQASLQVFLWYEVPREFPADAWRPLVEAAGVLLSLLGLDRYAAIARSPTTADVNAEPKKRESHHHVNKHQNHNNCVNGVGSRSGLQRQRRKSGQ